VTTAIGAVVRRATGARPPTTIAPAPEARSEAVPAPAHPSLVMAVLAMFAVVGAPPPHDSWMAAWVAAPRR
jgi:hypothetical protein